MKAAKTLQESLLVVLLYSAEAVKARHLIENTLYFTDRNKVVADQAFAYLDKYHEPARNHIVELMEAELAGEDKHEYLVLLNQLFASRDQVNVQYSLDQLGEFKHRQDTRAGIFAAAQVLQKGDETWYEEASAILHKVITKKPWEHNPGFFFGDIAHELPAIVSKTQGVAFSLGIDLLDQRELGPDRKKLHLFMAKQNAGKSWWLVNAGLYALLYNRAKVLHITLEMSQERVTKRYVQALYGVANTDEQMSSVSLDKESAPGFSISPEKISPPQTFRSEDVVKKIQKRARRYQGRLNRLLVKEFPTRSLTVEGLNSYLEVLDRVNGFVPDVVVLDYADILQNTNRDYRIGLRILYEELRGLAMSRNCALVTATQTNRDAARAALVTESYVGEDYSKLQTADIVISYSQTREEQKFGVARLHVVKSRNSQVGETFLIVQQYATGQFCLECEKVPPQYFEALRALDGEGQPKEVNT